MDTGDVDTELLYFYVDSQWNTDVHVVYVQRYIANAQFYTTLTLNYAFSRERILVLLLDQRAIMRY